VTENRCRMLTSHKRSERITAQPYTTRFADSLRWFQKRNPGKGKSIRRYDHARWVKLKSADTELPA